MLGIDDRVWLLWALWIMVLPLKWLLSAAVAACIHELCHIGSVILLGGRIRSVTVGALGAVIETEGISGYREAVCALAGPLGSLLLVLLIRSQPVLGLCALVQGVFNLLPVYPLDGGRALLCLLEILCPQYAQRLAGAAEICVFSVLLLVAAACAVQYSLGYGPMVFCALAIVNAILRKRP